MTMNRPYSVTSIFNANPDTYPPIINSSTLLAEAGFKVRIICPVVGNEMDHPYPDGVTVQRLEPVIGGSRKSYISLIKRSLKEANDSSIFIGHDMHGLLPAMLLARRFKRPLVYQCHELVTKADTKTLGLRIVRAFQDRFARYADLMIVPDAERAEILRKLLRLKRRPIVSANSPLMRTTGSRSFLREKLTAFGMRCEQIIFRQSTLGQYHALEATIRSMPKWANKSAGFAIIGPGKPEFLTHLRNLARQVGVEDRFHIFPSVRYDQVFDYTFGATIGHRLYELVSENVNISTTASNKLFEYMAAALPVLVSNRPGLVEFLKTYPIGLAMDEQNPDEIAACVNELLCDNQKRYRMGKCARAAFEDVFCYEKQFAPVKAKMLELVAQSKRTIAPKSIAHESIT